MLQEIEIKEIYIDTKIYRNPPDQEKVVDCVKRMETGAILPVLVHPFKTLTGYNFRLMDGRIRLEALKSKGHTFVVAQVHNEIKTDADLFNFWSKK